VRLQKQIYQDKQNGEPEKIVKVEKEENVCFEWLAIISDDFCATLDRIKCIRVRHRGHYSGLVIGVVVLL